MAFFGDTWTEVGSKQMSDNKRENNPIVLVDAREGGRLRLLEWMFARMSMTIMLQWALMLGLVTLHILMLRDDKQLLFIP